jgi:hypothetical protein
MRPLRCSQECAAFQPDARLHHSGRRTNSGRNSLLPLVAAIRATAPVQRMLRGGPTITMQMFDESPSTRVALSAACTKYYAVQIN